MKKLILIITLLVITSCTQDEVQERIYNVSHTIEFKTNYIPASVSIGLTTNIVDTLGNSIEIISEYNRDTKIIKVNIPENTMSFSTTFYIEDSSQVYVKFYRNDTGEIVYDENIEQSLYIYEYTFWVWKLYL